MTVRHQDPDQLTPVSQETRTFRTLTADLHALRAWLVEEAIARVSLESTGSYGKSVYNLLEVQGWARPSTTRLASPSRRRPAHPTPHAVKRRAITRLSLRK